MNFFDTKDRIGRSFMDLPERDMEDAYIDSYTSHQRHGAYFLEEGGYQRGDCELRDALVDAMDRGILPDHADLEYWEDEDWFYHLIEMLNIEFLEIYKELLEEARENMNWDKYEEDVLQ